MIQSISYIIDMRVHMSVVIQKNLIRNEHDKMFSEFSKFAIILNTGLLPFPMVSNRFFLPVNHPLCTGNQFTIRISDVDSIGCQLITS